LAGVPALGRVEDVLVEDRGLALEVGALGGGQGGEHDRVQLLGRVHDAAVVERLGDADQ